MFLKDNTGDLFATLEEVLSFIFRVPFNIILFFFSLFSFTLHRRQETSDSVYGALGYESSMFLFQHFHKYQRKNRLDSSDDSYLKEVILSRRFESFGRHFIRIE